MTALFIMTKLREQNMRQMENACCTCAAFHYMTKNKLFSANKALDLCGVIQALRQSAVWTD
jgi:hypothetical protein